MIAFPTERENSRLLFPFPEDGRIVEENPPCFSWLPIPGQWLYTVTIRNRKEKVIFSGTTDKNYLVPIALPEPGEYFWNITASQPEVPEKILSERGIQRFILSDNAVLIPRISGTQLWEAVPDIRPRHLFFQKDIPDILSSHKEEIAVLRRNIEVALRDGMPERPMYHRNPEALPYREYFGKFRDVCDRNLVALSLGYALLSDETAGRAGRELLLHLCDWNPEGPCSLRGFQGDEVGLSMARILPSAFDMLYPLLTSMERVYVAQTIRLYAGQCFERLRSINYCANPGDSHSGRIAAYMGEAAMVLKGTGVQPTEEGIRWLSYALEIYGGIFPHYGSPDGGWAEGAFYASSYTKWYLPFFCAVERYGGPRFLDRPFYQRFPEFLLHFANPRNENHPFGDGYWCHPESPEWPGFFAQNPFRVYAERTGSEEARELSRKEAVQSLYLLHLLDIFLPSGQPPKVNLSRTFDNLAVFHDTGFVSANTDYHKPEENLQLLVRASRFDASSHRHPDQGSFALYYRGIALISPSGYFGRQYGTMHHMQWLNSTKAHNVALIDGSGQKKSCPEAVGKIIVAERKDARTVVQVDLTAAYSGVKSYIRSFILDSISHSLTVTDEIETATPVEVEFPLHTLSRPETIPTKQNQVMVERDGIRCTIQPDEECMQLAEISDRYDVDLNEGEPEEFHVKMPAQYHIYYHAGPSTHHFLKMHIAITDEKRQIDELHNNL